MSENLKFIIILFYLFLFHHIEHLLVNWGHDNIKNRDSRAKKSKFDSMAFTAKSVGINIYLFSSDNIFPFV